MHVTLVPFIKAAGELKTKPTQQSIAKLREIGIQPQVLICRTEMPLDEEVRQKLSMFCNVPLSAVIEAGDVEHSIYEAPLNLHDEGLDSTVCRLLRLETKEPDLREWKRFVQRLIKVSTNHSPTLARRRIVASTSFRWMPRTSRTRGRTNTCAESRACWFPADSATVVLREKSRLSDMPANHELHF
jgi:CTP synthase